VFARQAGGYTTVMTAAKEKTGFRLAAHALLLLLLLAAVTVPAQAGIAPQNRAGQKSAANAAALLPARPQLLESQWGNNSAQRYDAPGDSFAPKSAPVRGAAANPAQRRVLYHYTDEAGMRGITQSGELRPSLRANNPRDVRYGEGQYMSDFAPGTKTPAQLSREFLGQPFQGRRFTHNVEIDVTGLEVVQGRNGVFVVPGNQPLDLTGRIVGSGPVPPVGR
jgi:hypothetical protein